MCTNITNTSCTEVTQGVAYCLLFLFGLLVNAAALWASFTQRASWTDTHIYIMNLVAADSTLILFLPFRIYDAFFCLPKTIFCTFLVSIHYVNVYASIYTSAAISVHRYLYVRFPMHARSWRKKKRAAFVVCLAIWVFVVTVSAIFHKEFRPENLDSCYERHQGRHLELEFGVVLISVGFLLPLVIIIFCTSQIIRILLKDMNTRSEEMKRSIGILTANMIVFIVCYTPLHIRIAESSFRMPLSDDQSRYLFLLISEWIASTNCCLDSISYYFLLKRFYS